MDLQIPFEPELKLYGGGVVLDAEGKEIGKFVFKDGLEPPSADNRPPD